MGDLDVLVEMGWSKEYAEKALKESKYLGLQAALDWIFDNPPDSSEFSHFDEGCNNELSNAVPPNHDPLPFVCNECGKILQNNEEVDMHSARSGHLSYQESLKPIGKLTDEEKQAQTLRLREAMLQSKRNREEQERQKCYQDEKNRRIQGKSLLSAKAIFREEMMKKEVEQMKKEKAADKAYREKLLTDMAKEKAEKLAKQEGETPIQTSTTINTPTVYIPPGFTSECRLQIRTPIGQPIKGTFKPSETLGALVLYVSRNWPLEPDGTTYGVVDMHEITLQTTFPKRKFEDKDFSKTLEELGLCPTAVLIARRNASL